MSSIKIEVITPEGKHYDGLSTFVLARAVDGELGILPGHAHLLAALDHGILRVDLEDGTSDHVAVFGGFMEVRPEQISVLTPQCELAEDIDRARAEQAKERATNRLANRDESVDTHRAQAALKRAEIRLKVLPRKHL